MGTHLSTLLKRARGRTSMRVLAERAGLSPRAVERYEQRGQVPRRKALHRLAQALALDVAVLEAAIAADANPGAVVTPPPALPLPVVLEALVERYGAEIVAAEAVAAAFRVGVK